MKNAVRKIRRKNLWMYFSFEPLDSDIDQVIEVLIAAFGTGFKRFTSVEVTMSENAEGLQILHISPYKVMFDRIRRLVRV